MNPEIRTIWCTTDNIYVRSIMKSQTETKSPIQKTYEIMITVLSQEV